MLKTVPAFPVQNIEEAVTFYESKLGFICRHKDKDFAILNRDVIEVHLWTACDNGWKLRSLFLFLRPIWSGAESFLAGTASCRIEVQEIDDIFSEYKEKGVLYHSATVVEQTQWGTREFSALDLHRNLLTFYEQI